MDIKYATVDGVTSDALIEVVMRHLSELAFVEGVTRSRAGLELETPGGRFSLLLAPRLHDLGRILAERAAQELVARAGTAIPVIVAPRIGPEVGRVIRDAGAGYVDARGNLDLVLGPGYVAKIQGRSGDVPAARGRSLGLAGYRVLFTLLARPNDVWSSARVLAEAAGVSRQPARDAVRRLQTDASMVRTSRGYQLLAQHYDRVLEAWLGGYLHVVQPKLELAVLRRPETAPDDVERAVAPLLDRASPGWRYGGTAAGFRLTGHYRGPSTVVHLVDAPAHLPRALGARPDPLGNLVVMAVPSAAAMESARDDIVHPLLIYTELMASGDERARESARELAPLFAPVRESVPRDT